MAFSDIKGQDKAIEFLKAAMREGKLSHAYIFAGPKGCGRSLLARNFAKAVNCGDAKNVPCGSCPSCRKVDKDTHPDVKWIRKYDKGGQIKIDQIRQLQRQIALKPYEGKYKVGIIADAGLMTIEAATIPLRTIYFITVGIII